MLTSLIERMEIARCAVVGGTSRQCSGRSSVTEMQLSTFESECDALSDVLQVASRCDEWRCSSTVGQYEVSASAGIHFTSKVLGVLHDV